MKKKLSVSIEEDILEKLETSLESRIFRNKSHVVEVALSNLLEKK